MLVQFLLRMFDFKCASIDLSFGLQYVEWAVNWFSFIDFFHCIHEVCFGGVETLICLLHLANGT